MKKAKKGFTIKLIFKKNLNEKEFDDIIDDLILEAIEKNKLMFGGGGSLSEYSGFITSESENKILTDKDRRIVKAWIENKKEIIDYKLGQLVDPDK